MNILYKKILPQLLPAAAALGLASCGMVYDDLDPCVREYNVRFSYTMNTLNAEAFYTQVKSVSLYIFDADERLVWSGSESGEALRQRDYAMRVDVEPGTYSMVVWGDMVGSRDFAHPFEHPTAKPMAKAELITVLKHKVNDQGQPYSDNNLGGLYHGYVQQVTFPAIEESGTITATIPLVKDTNNIRFFLQHADFDERFSRDDFDIRIEDANGSLNYDNTILDSPRLRYLYYSRQAGLIQAEDEPEQAESRADGEVNFVMWDISFPRIMADRSPQIIVTRNTDGKEIIRINLRQYLLLVKPNSNWTDQEYLDREDNYQLHFFLDRGLNWLNSHIYINNWHIVPPQESDL